MLLTDRVLNRTLWVRQHLAEPASADPVEMVRHLVGLQAQEGRSPYLSLRARVRGFDPMTLSEAIARRRLVRFLTLRGTVHVLTPDDAVTLRPWVQPVLDRISRSNNLSRPADDAASAELEAATCAALADGPLRVAELGKRLAEAFPGIPEGALRNAARERVPLVQLPPRGLWKQSGGVVYELVDRWLGRVLWDTHDAEVADPSLELPVRLLGAYDNLWLAHAERSRIADRDPLKRWMGSNGATGGTAFVDGFMAGTWRLVDGHVEVDPARPFTKGERAAVAEEAARVEAFLA